MNQIYCICQKDMLYSVFLRDEDDVKSISNDRYGIIVIIFNISMFMIYFYLFKIALYKF